MKMNAKYAYKDLINYLRNYTSYIDNCLYDSSVNDALEIFKYILAYNDSSEDTYLKLGREILLRVFRNKIEYLKRIDENLSQIDDYYSKKFSRDHLEKIWDMFVNAKSMSYEMFDIRENNL